MTVFVFNIFYSVGTEDEEIQKRYVLAKDSEEAEEKLIKYRDELVSKGFEPFTYVEPWVELDGVIA